MVITYSRVFINWVRLPILLVVSCTGKINISLFPFAPDILVSRDGLGSPVPSQPACSFSALRLNLMLLRHGIPPDFRSGVRLFIPPHAIESVPCLSGHAITYRWRSLSRVRRHRASSPQGTSSNGLCCLCSYHHGPIKNVRLSFPWWIERNVK